MAIGRISGPLLKANLLRDGVDLAFETDLLYLDVNNGRIGIKNAVPSYELDVTGTIQSTVSRTGQAIIDDVDINGNTIAATVGDLNINPATPTDRVNIGAATIPNIYGDVLVDGQITATGDIIANGDIVLGNADTDSVQFIADVDSNIIPNINDTYTLGNGSQRWLEGHFADLFVDGVAINTGNGNSVSLLSDEVNKIYVHLGGDDVAGNGENVSTAYRTIKHALSQATSGDTVVVSAGIFEEEFPLAVPAGVSVVGNGIRATTIKPTTATNTNDGFYLSGDSTVQNLSIMDMFYDGVADTGYAFQFDNGTTITRRSPYVKEVSVLNRGSVTTAQDPFGFAAGDAGRGIRVDGARLAAGSLEPAMLFDSVTLIVPNSVGLELTNGARVEWLNSFIYFADVGIDAYIGTFGKYGDGKTYLTLDGIQGTIQAGDTLEYYDLDGLTVIATDTVESVNGNIITIDGRSDDWIESEDRPTKTVSTNGDAQLSTLQAKFGSSSLQLDGTGDFLNILPNSDFGYGTSNFTIEGFIYPDLSAGSIVLDHRTGGTDTAIALDLTTGGILRLYSNGSQQIIANNAVTANTWNHFAIVRNNGTTTLYVNGVAQTTTYADSIDYPSRPLVIGASFAGSGSVNGFIDEFRISKGIARYTANFTPTTIPFVGDNATVLLLHLEGTNGSTDIVDDGVTFQDIRSSSGGTATLITRHDRKEFAAEMRSIASANVYGNRGIRANGADVRLRMSSHDFGYIGSGGDFSNNDELVNTANEVIELNEGRVFYSSTDQFGDYRIGDLFYVDQDTGAVTFTGGSFDVTSLTGINFTDGTNSTIIDPTQVQTGNLKLSGNTLESLVNGITIRAINNEVTIDSNLTVTGNFDLNGQGTFASVNVEDLTDNRIVIAGTGGELEDDSNFTFDGATLNVGATGEFTVDVATGNTQVKGTLDVDGQATIASANIEDLTTDRIVVVGTNGELEDDANFTWDGTTFAVTGDQTLSGTLDVDSQATVASLNVEDLTSGRVVLAGTTGEIEDSANLTFDGTLLTVTGNTTVTGTLDVDTNATIATLQVEDLSTGRVVIVGNAGEIEDSANLTFNGTLLTVTGNTSITGSLDVDTSATFATANVEDLTNDRIVIVGLNGELEDDSNFVFDGSTFKVGTDTTDKFTVDVATGNTTIAGTIDIDGQVTVASLNVEDLTSGRVLLAGTNGEVQDDANLTFDGTLLTVTGNTTVTGTLDVDTGATIATLQVEDLTSGRVVLAGTGGELEDSTDLTFISNILAVTGNQTISGTLDVDGQSTLASVNVEDLTATRVVFAGTNGELEDSASLVFDGTDLIASSVQVQDLTENRITIAGEFGALEDDANFTFDGSTFNIGATGEFTVDVATGATQIKGTLDVDGQGTIASLNVQDLTQNRITYAGTSGELIDSANLTFDGSTLTLNGVADLDNIRIDGNTISSTTGGITIDPSPVGTSGTLTIAGDLVVQGTTTTVESTVTTIEDPMLTLGGDSAPLIDDSKDKGIEFRWHTGAQAKLGFFGFDRSQQAFTFIADGSNTSEVFTGLPSKVVVGDVENTSLTQGRITFAGTGGLLIDDANLTWSGTALSVTGDLDVDGDIILGSANTQTITLNGEIVNSIIPDTTTTYDLGSPTQEWNNVYATAIVVDEFNNGQIKISTNVIENIVTNEGIIIRPNGSGTIDLDAVSAVKLPAGNEADRPSLPEQGQVRYNAESARVENYNGEAWNTMTNEDDAIAFSIALG